MKKFQTMIMLALAAGAFVSCSDSDDDKTPVVGITSVSVTPAGSAKAYTCVIDQNTLKIENTNDSVEWDVMDANLKQAAILATGTLGTDVYIGTERVNTMTGIDVTSAVSLTVKDEKGNSKTYTLNVVKAKTANGADMVNKSSAFQGFPTGLLDYDMCVFNGKIYAITTSLNGETENYQLFSSEDGIKWNEIDYKTDRAGVSLPEGQKGYVIGGEGARLAVFNGRMYVVGGARTFGADKYGNPADVSDGWNGPAKDIPTLQLFSTADGETFRCDSVGATVKDEKGNIVPFSYMNGTNYNVTVKDGKMYVKGGFYYGFGMLQGKRLYASTTDGKNWEFITPTSDDEDCDVARRLADEFFTFNGKMWCLTGFTNFIGAENFLRTGVYSSTDGTTWKKEGELTGMPALYHAKAIVCDNVVYMVGGETVGEDGKTPVVSSKIYRSTDCVNWTEVEVPGTFLARRNAAGVAFGNVAWIFGGINTPTTGNYGAPLGDTDTPLTDSWLKLIK